MSARDAKGCCPAKAKVKTKTKAKAKAKAKALSKDASLEQATAWLTESLVDYSAKERVSRVQWRGCEFTMTIAHSAGPQEVLLGTLADFEPNSVRPKDASKTTLIAATHGARHVVIRRGSERGELLAHIEFSFGTKSVVEPAKKALSRAVALCQVERKTPTYEETAKWLEQVVIEHSQYKMSYEASSRLELKVNGCDFVHQVTKNVAGDDCTWSTAGNLGDLADAPSTYDSENLYLIAAHAVDNRKLLRKETSSCEGRAPAASMDNRQDFVFDTSDIRGRFLKGLTNVILMCRETKEKQTKDKATKEPY